MKAISFCITTWNRYDFTVNCINKAIEDPRISEIIVSDDCSTDGSYEKLVSNYSLCSNVKFFRNESTQGCYRNKMISISLATNPWVVVADSDNEFPASYFDAIFNIQDWDERTVYQPDWAKPHFDFSDLAGQVVTRHNVQEFLKNRMAGTMFNAMNYFVNKNEYLRVWDSSHTEPWAADSIIQNYNWLSAGNKIMVVPNMHYIHNVHDGSHFKENQSKSLVLAKRYEDKLQNLR